MQPDNLQPINSVQPDPVPELPNKKQRKKDDIKNLIYTVMLFVLAPLFALFMIVFVFQSYVVDGSSMSPTLQNGNRVFILKAQKTIANIKGDIWIPARYEIIVFKKPGEQSVQLIKRVIGLPGDRVTVRDGVITIYNAANPAGFNPDANTEYGDLLDPTSGDIDTVVGKNELFVSGDNRSPGGSLDSRSGLGLVPAQNIVGRLWIRYFPLSEFTVFSSLKAGWLSALALVQNYK